MTKLKWVECPCRYCRKRYYGCHDKCEDYIKYQEFRQKLRLERQRIKGVYDYEA